MKGYVCPKCGSSGLDHDAFSGVLQCLWRDCDWNAVRYPNLEPKRIAATKFKKFRKFLKKQKKIERRKERLKK